MNGCHRNVKANKAEKWQKREYVLRFKWDLVPNALKT